MGNACPYILSPVVFTLGGYLLVKDEFGHYTKREGTFTSQLDACAENVELWDGHFNYVQKPEFGPNRVMVDGSWIRGGYCATEIQIGDDDVDCLRCLDFENFLVSGYSFIYLEGVYESKNPKMGGTGNILACLKDHPEGHNSQKEVKLDKAAIKLEDGPFDGYEVPDAVVHGNIDQGECEA